jgi:hypothetical protein
MAMDSLRDGLATDLRETRLGESEGSKQGALKAAK